MNGVLLAMQQLWLCSQYFHLMFAGIFHNVISSILRITFGGKGISVFNVLLWWLEHLGQVSAEGQVTRGRLSLRDGVGSGTSGSLWSSTDLHSIPDKHSYFLGSCPSSSLSSGCQWGISKGSSTEQNSQGCFDEANRNWLWGFVFYVCVSYFYFSTTVYIQYHPTPASGVQ